MKTNLLLTLFALPALVLTTPTWAGKRDGVYFEEPKNGAKVQSPFKVKFEVQGMTVKPAGKLERGTGHHHLLIDTDGPIKRGTIVPADEKHIHFGNGQTETELTLTPGRHKLTLQFADGTHASYGRKWSRSISVLVQ